MTHPRSDLTALIALLADDHPEIVEVAREKLVERADEALPLLREAIHSHADSKVRVEAQGVLERIRLASVSQEWRKTAKLPEEKLNLEESIFLLSKVSYPDLDTASYQTRLDELAQRIRPLLRPALKPREKLAMMNRVLFRVEGFKGNDEDYFDPQNSYLNRVLDRKLGIPISLSILYLLVAKRLKLPVQGVGIPGHFMVKYKDGQNEFYVDAFNAGRFLSRPECVQSMVEAGYPYQVEFLEGVGVREILARMLRNLILIYVDRHEQTLERTLIRFLDELYPSIS